MTAVVLALSAALAMAFQGTGPTPAWRTAVPLSDADRAQVLALASRVHINQIEIIRSDLIHQPLVCDALRIESVRAMSGSRVTWQRVWVTKLSSKCSGIRPDSPRVGEWVVAESTHDVGAWHVPDGQGFIDVESPSSISLASVTAIVTAIRTGSLLNRLPPEYRGNQRQIPKVDARTIYQVWNDSVGGTLYVVRSRTTNVVLVVAVLGTVVELREWRTEIA
jgi:hypothetical protein